MNDNQKSWVAALRSGKYKQGRKRLMFRDNSGELRYCCLGVACDLYNKANPDNPLVVSEVDALFDLGEQAGVYFSFGGSAMYMPQKVMDWLGLLTSSGNFTIQNSSQMDCLAYRNDNGYNFNQIADTIEHYKDQLFVKE